MSYPMDLEDYSDERLSEELQRRYKARQAGNCDNCGKPLKSEPKCRRTQRHDLPGDIRLEWPK